MCIYLFLFSAADGQRSSDRPVVITDAMLYEWQKKNSGQVPIMRWSTDITLSVMAEMDERIFADVIQRSQTSQRHVDIIQCRIRPATGQISMEIRMKRSSRSPSGLLSRALALWLYGDEGRR